MEDDNRATGCHVVALLVNGTGTALLDPFRWAGAVDCGRLPMLVVLIGYSLPPRVAVRIGIFPIWIDDSISARYFPTVVTDTPTCLAIPLSVSLAPFSCLSAALTAFQVAA